MSTQNLCPDPRLRFSDSNGAPLAGGKLWTYLAGTSTPRATYTDSTGVSANTNPIILDASGYCDVWIDTGAWKFVLTDSNDVTQWTKDNISLQTTTAHSAPAGGLTGQILRKISGTDYDWAWNTAIQSGQASLNNGDSSKAISFTSLGTTAYTPVLTLQNITDADPVFIMFNITFKSVTGFTAKFSAPVDSANYILNWAVILN